METFDKLKVSIVLRPTIYIQMDEIRHKIVTAANEMFMKFGIRSVTMDDIAKHLGMSKKTIYQSFAEKDELVQAVNQLHQDKWEAECVSIIANTSNAIEEQKLHQQKSW